MILKDKALLENLTRKYGKKMIMNEISSAVLTRAAEKATKFNRKHQAEAFRRGATEAKHREAKLKLDKLASGRYGTTNDCAIYNIYVNGDINGILVELGTTYVIFNDGTEEALLNIRDYINRELGMQRSERYLDVNDFAADLYHYIPAKPVARALAATLHDNFSDLVEDGTYYDWHYFAEL